MWHLVVCVLISAFIRDGEAIFLNIALNKTALSSTPLYSPKAVPQLVIDGIQYNPSKTADSQCFISSNTTTHGEPSWFAVDFGRSHYVPRMVFKLPYWSSLIKSLKAYNSLYNATVTMTDKDPRMYTPRPGSNCGKISMNSDGSIDRFDFFCAYGYPIGRYLIVQQYENSPGFLNICELEVLGMPLEESSPVKQWQIFKNSRISNAWIGWSNSTVNVVVRSGTECLMRCISMYGGSCTALNFQVTTRICFFSKFADPFPGRINVSTWTWMAPFGVSYEKF